MKIINTFDIDGVIFITPKIGGIHPGPNDVIITGRSYEEELETSKMLSDRGIKNQVFYNTLPFDYKTRESSGQHKAKTIKWLQENGYNVMAHFEDDEVQADIIKETCPGINVIMVVHDLTNKENVRHEYP